MSFVQKNYVSINEKGSDAGPAATGVVEEVVHHWEDRPSVICNKPFVYFFVDTYSGIILFEGIIRKP